MGWLNINGNWIGRHSGRSWSTYCTQLTAQATSDTEYTLVATASGTYDLLHIEYSSDMGTTWTEAGTTATDTYNATGMTAGTLYMWRARLSKGTNYSVYTEAINYLRSVDEPSCTMPTGGSFTISNPIDLNMFSGTDDLPFYISFWAKIKGGNYYMVAKAREYSVQFLANNMYFTIVSEAGTTATIGRRTGGGPQAGWVDNWHHFCFYYTGNKAHTGMFMYVDKVRVDVADNNTGTYANMSYYAHVTEVKVGDGGEISNFKIGSGALTTQQISDLYDNLVMGTEIIHFPCTEGYGTILHNVTDQNLEKHAIINGTGDAWVNTQDFFKYNYNYGGTKVNDYFFPNLNTKAQSFTPIDVIILGGQSNAEGAGVNAGLAGTDYDDLTDVNLRLAHAFQLIGGFVRKMDFANCFTTVGVDDILGYLYTDESNDVWFCKYGPGATGLYPGSSTNDWHPTTVGENFDTLAGYISAQLPILFARGREPWVKSFIWIQGERDASNATWAAAYYDNLVLFFNKWETLIYDNFNIQLARLPVGFAGEIDVYNAQNLYGANNSNVNVIDTDDNTTEDGTHYTSVYLADMAERMKPSIDSAVFTNAKSYINKIAVGYSKLYYTAHP